ncbi:MAG: hypothetical protein AAF899_12085 [Pseudomonadota bacterium]
MAGAAGGDGLGAGAASTPIRPLAALPRPIGIVCGLAAERDALAPLSEAGDIVIAVSGADPDRATRAAHRLLEAGCKSLMSCGYAGGLDPGMAPGDLFTAESVVRADGERIALQALPGLPVATLFGSDTLITSPDHKAMLHCASSAQAVDMETHRVAAEGRAAGVPVAALRAICDGAGRAMPAFLDGVVRADGRPRIGAVLYGLLANPGQIGALMAVARDERTARQRLASFANDASATRP